MRRYFFAGLIVCVFLVCTACGNSEKTQIDENAGNDSAGKDVSIEVNSTEEDSPDFSEIEKLFSEIIMDSETNVSLKNGKIHVKVTTELASESAPADWETTVTVTEEALKTACENAPQYNAQTVYVEIDSIDEKIMASGFDSKIRYNMFAEKTDAEGSNPPTITKFEYDQIAVGMSLTEVKEIIGGPGTLQSQIGEVSQYGSPISTYRWLGTKDGAYADILFDGYEVYSKIQIWLE